MKQFIAVGFLVMVFSSACAQMHEFTQFDTTKGIQVYLGAGAAFNNYENLNDALSAHDLPTTGTAAFSNILEADLRMKSLLFGLSAAMSYSPKRNDDYNTSVASFLGGLNVGYYIVNNKKFHLAPQVGIGINATYVKIARKDGYSDFDEVLDNGNAINLNQYTPVLDMSLKFDFADFTKIKTELAGIRAGYRLGLDKRGWGIDETANSTVDGSPEDRLGQFYVLLHIGFSAAKPVMQR